MVATLVVPVSHRWSISRTLWLVVAVAGGVTAVGVMIDNVPWWPVVVFAIAPDLSFLAGVGQSAARGQLPKRAVPVYNLVHRPLVPILMIATASVGVVGGLWLAAGLSWLTHIAADRATGLGLRSKDGWPRV